MLAMPESPITTAPQSQRAHAPKKLENAQHRCHIPRNSNRRVRLCGARIGVPRASNKPVMYGVMAFDRTAVKRSAPAAMSCSNNTKERCTRACRIVWPRTSPGWVGLSVARVMGRPMCAIGQRWSLANVMPVVGVARRCSVAVRAKCSRACQRLRPSNAAPPRAWASSQRSVVRAVLPYAAGCVNRAGAPVRVAPVRRKRFVADVARRADKRIRQLPHSLRAYLAFALRAVTAVATLQALAGVLRGAQAALSDVRLRGGPASQRSGVASSVLTCMPGGVKSLSNEREAEDADDACWPSAVVCYDPACRGERDVRGDVVGAYKNARNVPATDNDVTEPCTFWFASCLFVRATGIGAYVCGS